jgi:hypothetical protein
MLKSEVRARLCDEDLLEIREHHFSRLKALYNGELLDKPFVLKGIMGNSSANAYLKPELWVDEAMESLAQQIELAKDFTVFRPLVIEFLGFGGLYGVHFVDKILGANVLFREDIGQWFTELLKIPIGSLEFPNLENNKAWNIAKRMAERFLEWKVSVPIFGLPTIASPVNISVNLYEERLFTSFCDKPQDVKHDLKIINELLCTLHKWYLENIPIEQLQPVIAAERCQPPGHGQLCGCSTQLISSQIYKEFFAPLDDELFKVYPQQKGMIHLCGAHTQHIRVWKELGSFKAFQVNDRAAEDLEIYFKELREDQIIYVNLNDNVTLDKVLNITKGKRIVIIPQVIDEGLYIKITNFSEVGKYYETT